ncbi:uncharacterized protein LOC144246589 [Lonchura striata]
MSDHRNGSLDPAPRMVQGFSTFVISHPLLKFFAGSTIKAAPFPFHHPCLKSGNQRALKAQENDETALGQGIANLLKREKGLKAEKAEQGRAVDSLFKERHLQLENRIERSHNDACLVGEWFSSRPVLTAVLILLLLVLVLALGVALAVQSAPQVPVTPATPQLVLGCPHGWVGYNGVCYYLSRDYRSWDQAQERCSELGASLAILQDEAMDLLFRLRGNVDYWIGLRRRGERLHWGDGSSYSSRVPVFGNSECVYLAGNRLKSEMCSNDRPYVCSKAQAAL